MFFYEKAKFEYLRIFLFYIAIVLKKKRLSLETAIKNPTFNNTKCILGKC